MTPKFLWMRPVLGILVRLSVIALTGYMMYEAFTLGWDKLPKEMLMVLVGLVQALILFDKDSNSFYFGTTQGSANKQETIDTIVGRRDRE